MHIVRKVLPTEYCKYQSHLKKLDTASRHLRFTGSISDVGIDVFCNTVTANPDKHVLFAIENSQLEFVAVGHIAMGSSVELAFSVLPEHQGTGMGSALFTSVIRYCRIRNWLSGHMMCLPSNSAIRHLCTKYGIKMHNDSGDIIGTIDLPKPDLPLYIEETTNYNLSMMDFMAKRTMISWSM